MPDSLRSRVIQAGGPRMLSSVARARGFPSAQAMEFAIATAARLSQGGALTSADIAAARRHYPHVPAATLTQYAQRINAAESGRARRDMLVKEWGFGVPLAEAVREIESYAVADVAQAVASRASERERETTPEPDRDHPARRMNEDAAGRRALFAQQLAEPARFRPGSSFDDVRHQAAREAERDHDLYRESRSVNSRADDIGHAIDMHTHEETARELDSVADLVQPFGEATGDNQP